eukprot:scaffold94292_cov47-Prasinocladus_malaysianus.AAC.1
MKRNGVVFTNVFIFPHLRACVRGRRGHIWCRRSIPPRSRSPRALCSGEASTRWVPNISGWSSFGSLRLPLPDSKFEGDKQMILFDLEKDMRKVMMPNTALNLK